MRTLAIYGGSFDPPTLGHLMVVSHLLLNAPDVDKVLIVPCFKQAGKSLSPFEHRLTMCRLQFHTLSRTEVSPIERDLGGEGQTVRLVTELAKRHPETKLRFVMGADLLDSAPTWEGWDEIQRLAPPLVIGRAGISPRGPEDPTPISPIVSSTLVRAALKTGNYRETERYLTAAVLTYISNLGLYQNPSDQLVLIE